MSQRHCLTLDLKNDPVLIAEYCRQYEANPDVQRWEALMWTYQQALPDAPAGEKWQRMERVFAFDAGRLRDARCLCRTGPRAEVPTSVGLFAHCAVAPGVGAS